MQAIRATQSPWGPRAAALFRRPARDAAFPRCAAAAAPTGRSMKSLDEAMSTLDDLLGSRDEAELEEATAPQQQAAAFTLPRVPWWAWKEVREPRVAPVASNLLYYCVLLVYTLFYAVQLASGEQAADDAIARLANDHQAVAGGDLLRLWTSFFVSADLPQLVVSLLALATVAGELESLLGHSAFWALWSLTVISGSAADVALGELPVTSGPAAGVGGVAAALLAHHLHNWRIEQLIAQAREGGEVPAQLARLEGEWRARELQRLRGEGEGGGEGGAAAADAAAETASTAAAAAAAAAAERGADTAASVDDGGGDLVSAELEGPMGLSLPVLVPREVQAFLSLGGSAVGVLAALREAADSDMATDWPAVVAGFVIGGALGWLVCPVYQFELVPVSSSGSSGAGGSEPDLLLPVVRDARPMGERANAVLGCAALLFAAIGAFLDWQGIF